MLFNKPRWAGTCQPGTLTFRLSQTASGKTYNHVSIFSEISRGGQKLINKQKSLALIQILYD